MRFVTVFLLALSFLSGISCRTLPTKDAAWLQTTHQRVFTLTSPESFPFPAEPEPLRGITTVITIEPHEEDGVYNHRLTILDEHGDGPERYSVDDSNWRGTHEMCAVSISNLTNKDQMGGAHQRRFTVRVVDELGDVPPRILLYEGENTPVLQTCHIQVAGALSRHWSCSFAIEALTPTDVTFVTVELPYPECPKPGYLNLQRNQNIDKRDREKS